MDEWLEQRVRDRYAGAARSFYSLDRTAAGQLLAESAADLDGSPSNIADRRAGDRTRFLFLCAHNSARSQMAEGLLRGMAVDRFEVFSAGTESTRLSSATLDRYLGEPLDLVITVCDDANEACPAFPGARRRLHWSFPEP